MNQNEPKVMKRRAHGVAAGTILVLIGIYMLLSRWLARDLSVYLVLLLGLGMLGWGAYSRTAGWLVAGSILSGIGAGIVALSGPWEVISEYRSGVFLLCFALGWFLIPLLTSLFSARVHWWAFIPGGIMALIGSALLIVRGPWQADVVTGLQAGLLILAGLFLVFRPAKKS